MTEKKEGLQIEEAFLEIENIIKTLESDEISLKESIELYGNGVKLVSRCKEELSGIEKKMIVIEESMTKEGE